MFLFEENTSTRDAEKMSKNGSEEMPTFDRYKDRSGSSVGENFRSSSMNNHSVESIVNGKGSGSRKRKLSENLVETENCSKEKNAKVSEREDTNNAKPIVGKR